MSFHIDDEKLLEKHKDIWTKTKNLKNIKLNWMLYLFIYIHIYIYIYIYMYIYIY